MVAFVALCSVAPIMLFWHDAAREWYMLTIVSTPLSWVLSHFVARAFTGLKGDEF